MVCLLHQDRLSLDRLSVSSTSHLLNGTGHSGLRWCFSKKQPHGKKRISFVQEESYFKTKTATSHLHPRSSSLNNFCLDQNGNDTPRKNTNHLVSYRHVQGNDGPTMDSPGDNCGRIVLEQLIQHLGNADSMLRPSLSHVWLPQLVLFGEAFLDDDFGKLLLDVAARAAAVTGVDTHQLTQEFFYDRLGRGGISRWEGKTLEGDLLGLHAAS